MLKPAEAGFFLSKRIFVPLHLPDAAGVSMNHRLTCVATEGVSKLWHVRQHIIHAVAIE
jgi:hypothetical protein